MDPWTQMVNVYNFLCGQLNQSHQSHYYFLLTTKNSANPNMECDGMCGTLNFDSVSCFKDETYVLDSSKDVI